MFCGECGVENANSSAFCKNCGKSLSTEGQGASDFYNDSRVIEYPKVNMQSSEKLVSVLPIKALAFVAAIAATAVILLGVVIFIVSTSKTINLDKYTTISAEGYDGYGNAYVDIDWKAIDAKYGDKISYTSAAKKEYGDFIKLMSPVEVLQECVDIDLSKENGLSNGDEIEYEWKISKELSKYLNCKVKYKDNTYVVADLLEIGTFDAFNDLTVEFTGIAPNGKADIKYNGSDLNSYNFSCNKSNELKNGDIITVSIDENIIESCAQNLGKIPETMVKEYKVEGLKAYLESAEELDENTLDLMKAQAEDVYYSDVAKNWKEGEELENFTYLGNYFLTAKNPDPRGNSNIIYLVYQVQIHNSYAKKEKTFDKITPMYWYIKYTDAVIEPDGVVYVDVTNYDTPSNKVAIDSNIVDWVTSKIWRYYGYESLSQLYSDVVVAASDEYNHEDNVDESIAPDVENVEEVDEAEELEEEQQNDGAESGSVSPIVGTFEREGGGATVTITDKGNDRYLFKNTGDRYYTDKILEPYGDGSYYWGDIDSNDGIHVTIIDQNTLNISWEYEGYIYYRIK